MLEIDRKNFNQTENLKNVLKGLNDEFRQESDLSSIQVSESLFPKKQSVIITESDEISEKPSDNPAVTQIQATVLCDLKKNEEVKF